jgi:hypothetical protein
MVPPTRTSYYIRNKGTKDESRFFRSQGRGDDGTNPVVVLVDRKTETDKHGAEKRSEEEDEFPVAEKSKEGQQDQPLCRSYSLGRRGGRHTLVGDRT